MGVAVSRGVHEMAPGLEAAEVESSDAKSHSLKKESTHFEALRPPMSLFITCISAEWWRL